MSDLSAEELIYEDAATIEGKNAKLRRNYRIKVGAALVVGFVGGIGATLKFAYKNISPAIGGAISYDSLERADRSLGGVPHFPRMMPDSNCHEIFSIPEATPSFPAATTNVWENLDKLHVTDAAIGHLEDVQFNSAPFVRERPWILGALNRQTDVDCLHQVAGYYLPLLRRAREQYRGAIITAATHTNR